eukprot:361082-Chlamydomonas_euryale.AAC.7
MRKHTHALPTRSAPAAAPPHTLSSASSLTTLRLDAPMERTRPLWTRCSIAPHVSVYGGTSVAPGCPECGQWTRYRSR